MSNGYEQKTYGNGGAAARFRRPRRRICAFCADPDATIDYKNASRLRRYMSDRGKILPRRHSGNCAKHQRKVAAAIKRARDLALLPYVAD